MGNEKGFMEISREHAPKRDPVSRTGDWHEFLEDWDPSHVVQQAKRCMDCGIPFCQAGEMLVSRRSGCPVSNRIPDWNGLVAGGRWREALIALHSTNNFPEFTGRVCPAPCESACVAGVNFSAVTIKQIERTIVDQGFERGLIQPDVVLNRTGKKVAVIGSGPAGLACAAQLNLAGHLVTVFEREDAIGGLLRYGIPEMKLEKWRVQRRVDLLAASGVVFRTGVNVGVDVPVESLLGEFDAVVLCIGATNPNDLPVPGRQLDGVMFAVPFLTMNTRSLLASNHTDGLFVNARGLKVFVIGGGDTGTDCVGTSLRHGCDRVTQLEIMPEPWTGEGRPEGNDWPAYKAIKLTDYGQEEAIARFGSDPRIYEMSTVEILGDNGKVRAIRIAKVEWQEVDGGRKPVPIAGTEQQLRADLVLLAMGFRGPEATIPKALGLELDPRSNILTKGDSFMTSWPGIFTAGDARRGQSLVVWAIREGRQAARQVDMFLNGTRRSVLPED